LFEWLAKQPEDHLSFLPQAEFVALARQYRDAGVLTPKAHAGLKVMRKFHKGVPSGESERIVATVDELLAPPPKSKPSPEPEVTSKDDPAARKEAERLIAAMVKTWPKDYHHGFKPESTPAGKPLMAASPEVRKAAVFVLLPWMRTSPGRIEPLAGVPKAHLGAYTRSYGRDLLAALLRAKLPLTADDAPRVFKAVAGCHDMTIWSQPIAGLVALAERMNETGELTDDAREHLAKIHQRLSKGYTNAESRKFIARLAALTDGAGGDGVSVNCIGKGEAWSDAALADFEKLPARQKGGWAALLAHAATATSAKPSDRWEKEAAKLLDAVGKEPFAKRVLEWFPLVEKPRTAPWPHRYAHSSQRELMITDGNADVLRGLAWTCAAAAAGDKGANTADLCRALGRLCETSLKKLAGMGPRLPKLANAAVYALGKIAGEHALGQLARLKARVTFRTTLQQIEKALDDAAARLGVTKGDLEELGVPAYGFDEAGVRRETFDGVTCELKLDGRKVTTTWTNEKGKIVKAPPAAVNEKHAEHLKELKLAAADAEKMLTAQRDRIDGVMGLPKTWKLEDLRTRYLEHPLVGQIARRLIWIADDTPVLFVESGATDVKGKPVKLGKTAEVSLWHPAEQKIDEVVAWRRRLEELQITQPFKQAHREVYLLTDAERRTRTYSNRFAAHIIRQHQFHALAAQRGWRNKLRLMVDDTFPPASKALPQFDLRAEFWVEGVGDDYGTDTLDSGAYLRLTTDQVRFYRGNAEAPLPIDQVPALAFSEIMRDVDLFVGVASVGNDPTWQDGGPGGRYRDYWSSYAFGDLTETAKTRKAVLERLVPRLKIADRARLTDKFLVVRGDLRTYKIHLGSGNILMEPNDQYLCIVPNRATKKSMADDAPLFLPFEGDQTLSVIISKALLLAEDKKIKDSSIVKQIA
jgi:hypothetical protein